MSKLFACLISKNADQAALIAVATEFAYRIELLEDGILFDISGLEKLIGTPPTIASSINESMESHNVTGCLAVNPNLETAIILARQGKGFSVNSQRLAEINQTSLSIGKLPLTSLPLEKDTLGIFKSLGLNQIKDLRKIPAADLISRYGKGFLPLIDLINENSRRTLNHNLKADSLVWESDLEDAISDFEQLMFLIDHVLQEYLIVVQQNGLSTELIEIYLLPENDAAKLYQVKTT
ncbi:MAG TPA: hypothetical protein PKY82_22855, partial [Pyrinomonadaceae bacterium]|nr:hypothetical protein [Pyrinomonadaceae bacterium]